MCHQSAHLAHVPGWGSRKSTQFSVADVTKRETLRRMRSFYEQWIEGASILLQHPDKDDYEMIAPN